MGNILLVGVGIFMIFMITLGLKRGLIKMAFSFLSIFVILILVNILSPSMKELLKTTPVYNNINQSIEEYVNSHIENSTENLTQTGVKSQQKIIDDLPLPKEVKKTLQQNNSEEGYVSMQAKTFGSYIANSLTDMVLGALSFVIVFAIVSVLVRVLIHVLDIVAKLPVIHAFNSAGGALIGLVESVIILWIACIVVTIFSTTDWGQAVCQGISENGILSFIYDNNMIQKIITGIFTV